MLNHILEHRQFDFLPEFLKVIEDHLKENSADVLIKLLGNPNPVNPLRNFLNQPLNSNHQFNIATMLLDAICGDFAKATPEQQQARIVALLLNKEWLIAQASVQDNHDRLVKLLQNGALSVTYKKILFEALQAASAQNPEALKLYGKLLQQVAPEAPKVLEQKAELEIAAIFTEFARQDSNIHQLLNALTAEKSTLKELKEEKQILELQVARYAQSVQETTKQLKEHEEALKAMEATLQDTQMAFEEAQKRSLELTTQIEETNRLHEVEVERLKGDVLQSRSEAQAQLELAQQTHEKALGALRSELSQVQDSSQQLSLKLEQEQAGLEERTHELLELKSQFEDLGQERERLLSELSEARLNSEREKQEREELIRQVEAESQKQVQSEEKLRQLESSLSTLEKDNERLESQLQELQKQNAGFENQVQDLELQVARYAQSVQETTKQLKEHEEALKAMEATLQDTQMAFEEAQKRSLELTTQIEETNRLHEVEVERLKGDVLQSRSEAQAQLELAQQTHEKALGALRSELSQVQDSSQQLSLKLEQEQAGLEERTHELLELKSQFEDLGQERERLLSELSEARLNSEREKQEREELIRQVEAESQKQVQSEEKLRQLESSLSTLEKDNERLESQLQELQRQNEEFGAEIGNLKDQLKLATFERDSERQRANKAEEDLRAEQEKSKDLDNQLAEARRLIETMRKEMEELREKQQLQEEENKRQEEAVAAAKKEVDLRAKQLEEKEEALNVREKDVVRREEAAKEVEEQLASREQAVNIRERDLEQLTQEREEFQQEQEKFKQEREEFQQEREEFQQEREEFQQEQEKFKQEREEFQQEREEFQQEQEKFKQEREEFQQERKEFQQELEKFQQEREKFQQEREEFEKEKEELARVKEDNSALKKENELLTAQLEMLREALDAQGIEMDPKIMAQRQAIKLLTAQLKISKDDELLTKVKESDSNQDLKGAGLDSKLVANLMDEDAYTVLVPVAEERLRQLNDERIETRRKILASATYQDVLSDGEKELRGIYDNLAYLNKLDKTIQNELRDLAGSSPLDWFNPAFQSAAKEHAAEMYPHFEKLAGGCDTIVNYLKTLKVELNHQLACMPADLSSVDSVTQRKIIEHHKAKLTRYLSWVDNNLSLYEPLHKRLFGDDTAVDNPLLRLGVLNLLKQSMENKYRAQFLCFNSSYIDYPLAQRAAHFDSQYQAQVDNIPKPTGLQAKGEGRAIYHKLVGDAEKGFFREHVINPGEDTEACFLEEHNKHSKLDAEGNELISQEVSYYLTLNKFPQPSQHISPDELNKARVRVALAMATQMLADLGRAPTKDKPIILESHDYEEARYLFTALMLLGKKTPGMHFDFDAIVVLSEVFNPKQELQEDPLYRIKKSFGLSKFKYDFVANSCYETCFKQDPALDQMLAALQEAGEQQAAQKTKKEQTKASVTRVTSFFANGKTTQGEDFLEKLRQENQVKGPRSGG
ncbi:hypothetical protein [Legionella jordanis]|uniref:hypothetical protein n=1 Tax=Legionella jordanis TaxID=456 RepID=UPI000EFB825B|nr:hypothetical protein [Legionella jordanis]RMX01119.1 hypothetical protein EAW55_11085 [Legionella jordanis]